MPASLDSSANRASTTPRLGVEDEPQVAQTRRRSGQERLYFRSDVGLPVASVLKVALAEVVGEEEGILGGGADKVGRRAHEAADRYRQVGIRRREDLAEQALVAGRRWQRAVDAPPAPSRLPR